jgi:hypothetical protein
MAGATLVGGFAGNVIGSMGQPEIPFSEAVVAVNKADALEAELLALAGDNQCAADVLSVAKEAKSANDEGDGPADEGGLALNLEPCGDQTYRATLARRAAPILQSIVEARSVSADAADSVSFTPSERGERIFLGVMAADILVGGVVAAAWGRSNRRRRNGSQSMLRRI